MQMIKQTVVFLSLMLALLVPVQSVFAIEPDVLVKKTASDVLKIIKTDEAIKSGDNQKLFALAEEKILPNFDFDRVCRLVLGKHWRRATDTQKAQFKTEFRSLLLRTYSLALVKYDIKKIIYGKTKYNKDKTLAKVPLQIIQGNGPSVSLAYTLKDKDGQWKVYDIVIESISLVTSYRSQFSNEIRQNGLDSLISKLAEKNKHAVSQL